MEQTAVWGVKGQSLLFSVYNKIVYLLRRNGQSSACLTIDMKSIFQLFV